MRARSKKRAGQMRRYIPRARAFLETHRWCEFPLGCRARSRVVHHRRGREGERLLDERWWAASCHFHNDYAETRTGHSREIGWLLPAVGLLPEESGVVSR